MATVFTAVIWMSTPLLSGRPAVALIVPEIVADPRERKANGRGPVTVMSWPGSNVMSSNVNTADPSSDSTPVYDTAPLAIVNAEVSTT